MTPFGRRLMGLLAMGLNRTLVDNPVPKTPLPPTTSPEGLTLADYRERIARDMWNAWALMNNVTPPAFDDLRPLAKERYRQLATRALRNMNPETRLQAMKDAIESTERWLNEPYGGNGTVPEPAETMLHVLMEFDHFLAEEKAVKS